MGLHTSDAMHKVKSPILGIDNRKKLLPMEAFLVQQSTNAHCTHRTPTRKSNFCGRVPTSTPSSRTPDEGPIPLLE